MNRPCLLDLFCGAGGCAVGYHRAGFDVMGVDHEPQPNYPFEFVEADAISYAQTHGHLFDAIHASPPCQAFSRMRRIKRNQRIDHPDLVETTRRALVETGRPWIIENVEGAPLVSPVVLCGLAFGLRVYRHRLFESNVLLLRLPHQKHTIRTTSRHGADHGSRTSRFDPSVVTYTTASPIGQMREAMGIDWMTQAEITQAIPPAYTEFLGRQLLQYCAVAA